MSDDSRSISFVDSSLFGERVMALSSEEALARRANSWKGWYCSAGFDNIFINADGNIYVAACKMGGPRGNIYDGDFSGLELVKKARPGKINEEDYWVQCDQDWCMCGQDMLLRKSRKKKFIGNTKVAPSAPNSNNLKSVDWVVPYHFKSYLEFPKYITWDLGRRCNYACDYCHPSLANNYEAHRTWGSLMYAESMIEKCFLKKSKAKWVFTGGEPTVNPSYMDFIKYLRDKGHNLHTQTNGSRSPDYYAELIKHSCVGISLHLKYYQEKSFLETCQAIIETQQTNEEAAKWWFSIRIMVPPECLEKALEIKHKILSLPRFKDFKNIHLSPLYKQNIKSIDEMIEYDPSEYQGIIAHS